MASIGVITANTPNVDECPALTRTKVFVSQLGIQPTLEHTLRDVQGNPLDLSSVIGGDGEDSESEADAGAVWVRSKELIAPADENNVVITAVGTIVSAENGTARFPLEITQVAHAGIYQLSFAVLDSEDSVKVIDSGLLWVERSLFGALDTTHNLGPPTMMELRQAVMDTGSADNLLLDEMEFTDDQLASAVGRPLQFWNTRPPPIRPQINTRNFPFRENWLRAICGHLFEAAAHNYRRNHLEYQAGGLSINDKDKEGTYMRISAFLLEEWRDFVDYKKLEINTTLCVGSVGSSYGFY